MTFERNLPALEQWADALVCPACLGALRVEESRVVCAGCGRIYPVVDGIPVLIAERATKGER
jgi:uncharacterized protein YbaR (Trm112 family)